VPPTSTPTSVSTVLPAQATPTEVGVILPDTGTGTAGGAHDRGSMTIVVLVTLAAAVTLAGGTAIRAKKLRG
jgi:hypothetical protein